MFNSSPSWITIKRQHSFPDVKMSSVAIESGGPAIKDFEFHKPISQGAFGEVYLGCKKSKPETKLAIKIMDKDHLRNKNMLEQAQEEKNALAILEDNPHVVKLLYCLQSLNKVYLVMEYLVGGDLKSLLEVCGCFNDYMIAFYTAEIALALKFLNDHKIVHRDIKPDNCLIDKRGHVKLTDFGLAKINISSDVNLILDNIQSGRTPGQIRSLKTVINAGENQKLNNGKMERKSSSAGTGLVQSPPLPVVRFNLGNLSISSSFSDESPPSSGRQTPSAVDRTSPGASSTTSSTGSYHDGLMGKRGTKRRRFSPSIDATSTDDKSDLSFALALSSCNSTTTSERHQNECSFSDISSSSGSSKLAKLETDASEMSAMIAQFERIGIQKEGKTVNVKNVGQQSDQLIASASSIEELASLSYCKLGSNQLSLENASFDDVLLDSYHLDENINCSLNEDDEGFVENKENYPPPHLVTTDVFIAPQPSLNNVAIAGNGSQSPLEVVSDNFKSPQGSKCHSVEMLRHETTDEEPSTCCGSQNPIRQRILSFKIETPDQKRPLNRLSWVKTPSLDIPELSTPPDLTSSRDVKKSTDLELKCPQTPFTPGNTPYSKVKNSAKRSSRRKQTTNHFSTDRILGTPDYIAPEMILKGNRNASYAVDWWSLGVCMFEFATGVLPFNDETPAQVLQNILTCDIPWPTGEEKLDYIIVEPIKALLDPNPETRANLDTLKRLKLFDCIDDWSSMLQQQSAPFVPVLSDDSDTEYFRPRNDACNIKMTMSRLLQTGNPENI